MGRLERHLDSEAVRRVLAGIRYEPRRMTQARSPRPAATYRAARRNTNRRLPWRSQRQP
jgi:hypothetical protein